MAIQSHGLSCRHEVTAEEVWRFYGILQKLTNEEKKEIYRAFEADEMNNIAGKDLVEIEDIIETYSLNRAMCIFYSWKAYKEKGIKVGSVIEIPNTEDEGVVLGFEGEYLSIYGDFNSEIAHVRLFKLGEIENTDRFIDFDEFIL